LFLRAVACRGLCQRRHLALSCWRILSDTAPLARAWRTWGPRASASPCATSSAPVNQAPLHKPMTVIASHTNPTGDNMGAKRMPYCHFIRYHDAVVPHTWMEVVREFKELVGQSKMVSDTPVEIEVIQANAEIIAWTSGGYAATVHRSGVNDAKPAEQVIRTDRHPHDLVVSALLLRIYAWAPRAVEIRSDGALDDWQPAIDLVTACFGTQPLPPFLRSDRANAPASADQKLIERARWQAPWLFRGESG